MARIRLTGSARNLVRSFDDLLKGRLTGRTPLPSLREVYLDTAADRPYRTGPNELVVGRRDAIVLRLLARSRDGVASRAMVRLQSDRVQSLLVDLTQELSAPAGPDKSVSPFSTQGNPLGPSPQAVGRAYADAVFPTIVNDVRLQEMLDRRLFPLWARPLPAADAQVRLVGEFSRGLSDIAGLRGADGAYGRDADEPLGPDPLLAAMHNDPRRDKMLVAAETLIDASSVRVAPAEDRRSATRRLADAIGGRFGEAVANVRGGQPAAAAASAAAVECWEEYVRVVREYGIVSGDAAPAVETTAETAETARGDQPEIEVDRWLGTAASDGRSGAAALGRAADDDRAPSVANDRTSSRPEPGR